jgi:hypothetical protein
MSLRALAGLFSIAAVAAVAAACADESDPASGSSPTNPAAPSPDPGRAESGGEPGGGGDGDGGDGGAGGEAPAPYRHFDVNHVLSTGQSNAVANDAKPVLTTEQPFDNLMFDVGVMTGAGCDRDGCTRYDTPTAFVPLVEGDTFFYPVETPSSGLANQAARLAKERYLVGTPHDGHRILVSVHGRSGNSYSCLRKGGCDWWPGRGYVAPFDDAMRQVADAKAIADAAGQSYAVRAVTTIHGEHDHYAYSSGSPLFPLPRTDGQGDLADYADALEEWQRDYESEVKAITGQSVPIPLFLNQYSHWNDVPTTQIAFMQLDAHVRSTGKVVVVAPTYQLPYTSTCLHFTNEGSRWLGEYLGKAYAKVVVEGRPWEPLRPIAVQSQGSTVVVRFVVPVPPLVLDTTRVSDPGDHGFEVVDGSGAKQTITSVAVTAPDAVTLTLDGAPPATGRVRYAYTFTGCTGSGSIARGNLRDSDATPSLYGNDLFNWAVHFDEPLP